MFRVAGAYAVVGWLMMQLAVVLEGSLTLPGWFDTFVTVIVLLGFPFALFMAWAFELTPEGVRPTEPSTEKDPYAHKTGRKLEYAIIAGILLIAGLMISDQFFGSQTAAPPIAADTSKIEALQAASPQTLPSTVKKTSRVGNKSVAVLPFENRSAVEDDAFFAAGIHDDLLTQLSKISALKVISRTSVMGYAESGMKIPDIANELGVAVIMEGAVQRGGERVLISADLIDGATDVQLWGEKYNRELTTENIFDIQSEITYAIAESLEAVLTGQDESVLGAPKTQSIAAYDNYIRGQILMLPGIMTETEIDEAIADNEAALRADPNFALAWAAKARAEITKYWFFGRNDVDRDAARESLDNAQAMSPDSAETLTALAFYHYWGLGDLETADAVFERAIAAAPNNSSALAGRSFIMRRLGRFEEAAITLERAHRLDPLTYYLIPELALTYAVIGRFDEANDMIERAKKLNPTSQFGGLFEAAVWQFQGEPEKSWKAVWIPGDGEVVRFYEQLADYALRTRDPEKIKIVKNIWPEDKRSPDHAPELYNIFKVKSFLATGDKESAQTELDAMQARIKNREDKYPADWVIQPSYSPAVIPGLLGDLETVEKVAKAYEVFPQNDALTAIPQLGDIADAFARSGDVDSALDYMDRMVALTGPSLFLVFENEIGLDNVRNHPRYIEMKANFDRWAQNNPWQR